MEEKINILPTAGSSSLDAMAMMNNNPWMYLVMLALFANGGFGGFGGNAAAGGVRQPDRADRGGYL